jgi:hypothetical protein
VQPLSRPRQVRPGSYVDGLDGLYGGCHGRGVRR